MPQDSFRPALTQGWTVWNQVLLRAAGFPAKLALKLAATRTVAWLEGNPEQEGFAALDAPEFLELWKQDQEEISQMLAKTIQNPLFQEALTWQNRAGLARVLSGLQASASGPRNRKARLLDAFVAGYLQRYAMKNDTIGFFGPIGWASFTDADPVFEAFKPGSAFLAARTVYFEPWAILVLAESLAQEPDLRPYLKPRLHPRLRIEHDRLYGTPDARSLDGGRKIPASVLTALQEADGKNSAKHLAQSLQEKHPAAFPDTQAALDFLEKLAAQGWLRWNFEVPLSARPELFLKAQLEQLADPSAKEFAMRAWTELVSTREALAQAAGDPKALDAAFQRLEAVFTQKTGQAATRHAGRIYAGRTLVYEDCRRALDLKLGKPILDRLARPLELILSSARWYTSQIAENLHQACLEAYDALIRQTEPGRPMDFARLWDAILGWFDEPEPFFLTSAVARLKEQWHQILQPDPEARRMEYSSDDLAEQVHAAFDAVGPGWPSAVHHCPDIMVAAKGRQALETGDFQLILGELHPGLNTFSTLSSICQHPDPEALRQEFELDLEAHRITPLLDTSFARSFNDAWLLEGNFHLDSGVAWSSWRPDSQKIRLGDCKVEKENGRLYIKTLEEKPRFDLMQILDRPLKLRAAVEFGLLPAMEHGPRISIDGVVVARERWSFFCDTLDFCMQKTSEQRFLAARAWAREHGFPRFVFARPDAELKPVFVDLDSPVLVDSLAKLVRQSEILSVVEMLPAPDQLWLEDAQGEKYVAELRMVAVDPKSWQPGNQS